MDGVEVLSESRRLGTISLVWADGEHDFVLKIKQLIELQDKCDAGPAHVLSRLQGDQWRVEDVREPIRLGLIGAGMDPTDAATLVIRYVDELPLLQNVLVAQAIMAAAIVGVPGDQPPGKSETTTSSSTSEAGSSGEPSSEPASPAD